MAVIEVQDLSKRFRLTEKEPGVAGALKALLRPRFTEKVAVDGISFAIDAGETVGYIGVNGAGKSTTIKLLTGILKPSGGNVRVLGRDPYRERIANAHDIGAVFGQRTQLWWDLALIESFHLIREIYDMEPARYRQLLDRFTEMLDLGPLLKVPVRSLSLGQKMRAELAVTLLHEPKVVYLDEPTIGLDVLVKGRIREFIRQVGAESGTTVILTTHDMSDIEELCRRVIMIDGGRIIYDGPIDTIRDRFGRNRLITFDLSAPCGTLPLPGGAVVQEATGNQIVVGFDRTRLTASQVSAAVMAQAEVADFRLTEPDLESIVKQIYGGALKAEEAAV
jgi:ABC-2 type transport system ATP-binding protein